jgi:hypothetical protein
MQNRMVSQKGTAVESIGNFFNWLFSDRVGVLVLLGFGVVLFLLIAFLLEKRMRKQFYNHKKTADDWDLFDTNEDE